MPVKPLARRATSPTRGRHLVATDHIQKGQLVFCERPMVALQSTGNIQEGVLVCQYCLAFCGSPAQALCIAADPSQLQTITTTEPSPDQQQGDHALIPCRHKCGHVYCSEECRQDDWEWGGHGELCTGRIETADHPLVQCLQHAVQTNEIFILIAKWLARIQKHNLPYQIDEESIRSDAHPLVDFSMKLWWEVATLPLVNDPMGFAEMIALEQSCRRLCDESCALLQAAWPQYAGSPWLTPQAMARLIGSLEQNCIGMRRKHALRQDLLEDTELRHTYHNQLVKCLEKAGMIGNDNDDDCCKEEESNGEDDDKAQPTIVDEAATTEPEPEDQWDYTPDEIAEFLANLSYPMNIGSDDEWDAIITPLDGTGHFGFTEKMNHSCDPNMVVLYKSRGWGRNHPLAAYCVALKDIEPEEELTIAYVETKEPYDVRQKALANYGFVCQCSKCEREKGMDPVSESQIGQNATSNDATNANEADEQDLFGSDGEDDDDEEGMGNSDIDGDAKLKTVAEQMESIWNKSNHATIPVQYLAPAFNYVVQLVTALIQSPGGLSDEKDGMITLEHLQQCLNGANERDFSLCRIVGPDMETRLYRYLQKQGKFSTPEFREAYWCACSTSAIGLAQEGSFLLALQYLDKATVLGLKRESIGDFFSYVEMFATQMSATPCPHAIHCTIADYREPGHQEELSSSGLSSPISFPVKEVECSPSEFGALVKNQTAPIVIRGLAKDWPATTKWRNMECVSRAHGHRLVPIEVGSMVSGMKEQLLPLREFISSFLSASAEKSCWSLQDATDPLSKIAYLAQHPLLEQLPTLYDDVERNPCGVEPTNVNAWIGTGGTRTPLHFDSYDNLLIQLVGAKYVRLYHPSETERLYVSRDKGYGLQGNMSQVDCELEDYTKHPLAKGVEYTEVLLLPGDCLYIPSRYWHYVRSLTTSASINYWF